MSTTDRQQDERLYHGRTPDYQDFRVVEEGRKIERIETFSRPEIAFVRVTTADGAQGWGQVSTYSADIASTVLHRHVAPHFLGKDPARIDALVDRALEANLKFPWSFVCRALGGVDTAIWDLYGQITGKPVVALLGGEPGPQGVYGSSMRRDITPEDEAARLVALRDRRGYRAFKIRAGSTDGHDRDAWPGRTETLIPTVRQAVGDSVDLLIDGNSCYTPDAAIAVGRLLEDNGFFQFEEPCPYWELEWTKQVTDALSVAVSGGEQDNDLAQWRRMMAMHAVDIVQPDILYLGGVTRTWRVVRMAEAAGLRLVPHSANHGLVTLFSLHVMKAATAVATPYLEYSIEFGTGVNAEARSIYAPGYEVVDGDVRVPDAPGWGVTLSQDWLSRADYQVSEV